MPAPAFITSLLGKFPLVEYEEELVTASQRSRGSADEYPSAPAEATLWVYGPGISNEPESFDLECLRYQAEAAFKGVKLQIRCLQIAEGAPGAALPALHLPDGDLLSGESITKWIAKQPAVKSSDRVRSSRSSGAAEGAGSNSNSSSSSSNDDEKHRRDSTNVQIRIYTTLVESRLRPALLAHLFLNPKVYKRLSIPLYFPQTLSHGTPTHPASPLLTRYAYSAMAKTRKLEVQAEVAKLLQSSGSSGTKLDLEEIIRSGQEAIETLANKLEGDGSGWFFGTEHATSFDAILYAHLHLIHLLHAPHLGAANPLRRRLEKQEHLAEWAKRLHKEYFQPA